MIKLVRPWLLPRDKRPMALPMRCLGAGPADYTWEDWEAEMQREYPVRFGLSLALQEMHRFFFSWPRLSRAGYWLRTHTYNRYHVVDLRRAEPENPCGYRWGWIERNHALLLAAFTVLRDFVELEEPWDCGKALAAAEANPDRAAEVETLREQKAVYDEIMTLYRWWTVDRHAEKREHGAAAEAARLRYEADNSDITSRNIWLYADDWWSRREDEMLCRLVAVRHHLWT